MDFFDRQEAARRISARLVLLFVAAVLAMIGIAYLLATVIVNEVSPAYGPAGHAQSLWNGSLLVAVSAIVLVVVGGLAAWRIRQFRAGGYQVAEMLEARQLDRKTSTYEEKQLLNVVEEMAIAAGIPVPAVYLLDHEGSINGFAAGHSVDDAVIAITRGSLEKLDREELQGIVAHEISHVINGDIRLNLRLVGLLYGIMGLGMMGWLTMNGRSPFTVLRSDAARRKASTQTGMLGGPSYVVGFAFAIVGAIGTFFGKLIKSAVARQREFLADASALQLTRNPEAVGGALRKVAFQHSSSMSSAHGAEIGHMLFTEGFGGLYATHPPVVERIRRVDARLLEEPPSPATPPSASAAPAPEQTPADTGAAMDVLAAGAIAGSGGRPPAALLEQLGQPGPVHLAYARELLASVPEPLEQATHTPVTAQALICALLLDRDPSVRTQQLDALSRAAPAVHEATQQLHGEVAGLDRRLCLPLVDKALPALGTMTEAQARVFQDTLHVLVEADDQVSLFEWVILRVVTHHLDRHFHPSAGARARHRALRGLAAPCAVVLSALAHYGQREASAAGPAFEAGAAALALPKIRLLPRDQATPSHLDTALQKLAGLAPDGLRKLLTACALTISADEEVTPEEAEIFRAIADALDCPAPPLLPGQPLVHTPGPSSGLP